MKAQTGAAFPLEGDLSRSPAGSRYAGVVERLLQRRPAAAQLLVTSIGSGDGKTTTATNLALAFHARRIPVLLIEASLQQPSLSGLLGEAPSLVGVEDVLSGTCRLQSILCRREDSSVHFAMVKRAQASCDLLASGTLPSVLDDARQAYAWTIVDGPSMQSPRLVQALAAHVGLTLVVLRTRQTRRAALRAALAMLDHTRTMVLLND